jgi:hypothetical protein
MGAAAKLALAGRSAAEASTAAENRDVSSRDFFCIGFSLAGLKTVTVVKTI